MLRVLVNILGLRLDDIVLKFLDQLIHEDGGALTNSGVEGEHHPHDRHDELIRASLAKHLDADLYIAHANLPDFVLLVSQALNHQRHKFR